MSQAEQSKGVDIYELRDLYSQGKLAYITYIEEGSGVVKVGLDLGTRDRQKIDRIGVAFMLAGFAQRFSVHDIVEISTDPATKAVVSMVKRTSVDALPPALCTGLSVLEFFTNWRMVGKVWSTSKHD